MTSETEWNSDREGYRPIELKITCPEDVQIGALHRLSTITPFATVPQPISENSSRSFFPYFEEEIIAIQRKVLFQMWWLLLTRWCHYMTSFCASWHPDLEHAEAQHKQKKIQKRGRKSDFNKTLLCLCRSRFDYFSWCRWCSGISSF